MPDAVNLIRAVLGDACPNDDEARRVLDAALEREVDPLLYCAATMGVGEQLAMERAAYWADIPYFDVIPRDLQQDMSPSRLESLVEVRVISLMTIGRSVAYGAPNFFGLMRLRERRLANPSLHRRLCLVPQSAINDYLARAASTALITAARQNLTHRWPFATAQLELTTLARCGFVVALILFVILVLMAPYLAQAWLLPLAVCALLGPAVIRMLAIFTSPAHMPRQHRPNDAELPVYSVLIPLRDETAMVPQLFTAMWALDYPPERLDIKFVVETNSPSTIAAVERRLGDPRFSLVRVADALPRTKPKALDYALPLCRGEFIVVYDAEDTPDSDQLWKAAQRFSDAPDIACLQARLVIENGRQNWLSALFAGEYAGLFTVLLPALARLGLPVPLGGTSNHFRIATLRRLGGWDAFNVTEDADIGIRLARMRLRVETLDSATLEAAPTQLRPWLGQRSRWMKGWMQTFIVHNRDAGQLLKEMGLPAMLTFEVLVLGMIIAPFLHVCFLSSMLAQLMLGLPPWSLHDGWPVLYFGFLGTGYGTALAMTALGLARLRRLDLLAAQVLLPLYWLLMTLATLRALIELTNRPFYWFKSPHRPTAKVDKAARERRNAADARGRQPASPE